MIKGQSEDKIQSTYDKVMKGFDLTQVGIDIKRESSLFDFESRRTQYQFDLEDVKSQFQDKMDMLIADNPTPSPRP